MRLDKSTIITIITLIFIVSMFSLTVYFVDRDKATGVYHMKGELFNMSISHGDIQVSPELDDNIFFIALFSLMGIMFLISIGFTIAPNKTKEKQGVKGW